MDREKKPKYLTREELAKLPVGAIIERTDKKGGGGKYRRTKMQSGKWINTKFPHNVIGIPTEHLGEDYVLVTVP